MFGADKNESERRVMLRCVQAEPPSSHSLVVGVYHRGPMTGTVPRHSCQRARHPMPPGCAVSADAFVRVVLMPKKRSGVRVGSLCRGTEMLTNA